MKRYLFFIILSLAASLMVGCATSKEPMPLQQASFNPSIESGNNYIYRGPPRVPVVGVHVGR